MIDQARHDLITRVMDMLVAIPDKVFVESGFNIAVELHDQHHETVVKFYGEGDDWFYTVETQ